MTPRRAPTARWSILAAAGMVVIRGEAGARNTVVTLAASRPGQRHASRQNT